jgi:hypothetical protein
MHPPVAGSGLSTSMASCGTMKSGSAGRAPLTVPLAIEGYGAFSGSIIHHFDRLQRSAHWIGDMVASTGRRSASFTPSGSSLMRAT